MPTTRRTAAGIAITALAIGSALTLSACSSTPEPAPTKAASSSAAAPSETPIGGDTLPPVVVSEGMTAATAVVGDSINFKVENVNDWAIVSDNPAVVSVTQGSDDGTVTMLPGGEALAAGIATVTLENQTGGEAWVVTITVSDTASEPSAGVPAPVMVTPGMDKVDAKVGNDLYFSVENVNDWAIVSDNPAVVSVTQGSDDGNVGMVPGGKALAAGTATITLENQTTMEAWIVVVTVTQ